MEKHELSKIDFEIIEDAKALLQSRPDPVAADKIVMTTMVSISRRHRPLAPITDLAERTEFF
jgi:hypothetical protein